MLTIPWRNTISLQLLHSPSILSKKKPSTSIYPNKKRGTLFWHLQSTKTIEREYQTPCFSFFLPSKPLFFFFSLFSLLPVSHNTVTLFFFFWFCLSKSQRFFCPFGLGSHLPWRGTSDTNPIGWNLYWVWLPVSLSYTEHSCPLISLLLTERMLKFHCTINANLERGISVKPKLNPLKSCDFCFW